MPPLVTVWRISLNTSDEVLAPLQALLSNEERSKAARFKSEIHRRHYIMAHGAMRRILSRETECVPDRLDFIQTRFGKPALEYPFDSVQFNLSHSADMALLAVCRHGSVGVDIEQQRPLADLDALVDQVCSPAESQLFMSSAEPERMFYRCWVAKEAALKCIGLGLRVSMKDFDVLDAQRQLITSPALPIDWPQAGKVHLQLLDILSPGFAAAVCVLPNDAAERTETEVRMQDWQP